MTEDGNQILQSLKRHDPARYLAALYLPQPLRIDVATLWAFDAEIARIPDLVSEPMPGEIRIQWWRDLVRSGDNSGSGPLAKALMDTIARHDLPREVFDTCLEARIFDLYQDPMPDKGTLEGYLGETVSSMYQMAALCAGAERNALLADACGHAGMAYGMAKTIMSLPKHRSRGQMFVPLSHLKKFELDRTSWLQGDVDERHSAALSSFLEDAAGHQKSASAHVLELPATIRGIFRANLIVDPVLAAARKAGSRVLSEPVSLSPLKRYWIFAKSALAD